MAVPTVRLDSGNATMIPYTPGSAYTAGTVVVQGDLLAVGATNIDADREGSLQVIGPQAVWIFPKSTGSGTALTAGQVVYWDAGNTVVTTTASTHKICGKVVEAAGVNASTVLVMGVQQKTP